MIIFFKNLKIFDIMSDSSWGRRLSRGKNIKFMGRLLSGEDYQVGKEMGRKGLSDPEF